MNRANRRHHEERVKAKWRRRVRRERDWGARGRATGYTARLPEKTVNARAVRLAHHNKCPCSLCKPPPNVDRLPKPAERRAGPDGGGGR